MNKINEDRMIDKELAEEYDRLFLESRIETYILRYNLSYSKDENNKDEREE